MDMGKRRARERSTWQLIALRFCKNRLAMAGVIVLGLMILAILLAPLYMPYEEMIRQDVFNKLQPPSAQHPLGTSCCSENTESSMLDFASLDSADGGRLAR